MSTDSGDGILHCFATIPGSEYDPPTTVESASLTLGVHSSTVGFLYGMAVLVTTMPRWAGKMAD